MPAVVCRFGRGSRIVRAERAPAPAPAAPAPPSSSSDPDEFHTPPSSPSALLSRLHSPSALANLPPEPQPRTPSPEPGANNSDSPFPPNPSPLHTPPPTLPRSPLFVTPSQPSHPPRSSHSSRSCTPSFAYPARSQQPPPPPQPNPSPANGLTRSEYDRTQTADQPRLPWHWTADKSTAPYTPVVPNKWWSDLLDIPVNRTNANRRRVVTNACRIMELELGEQKFGDDRCDSCRERRLECWVYSREGALQVSKPGDACARCRVKTQPGGCSLSKRKKNVTYKRKRGGGGGGDGGRSPTPPKRPPPPLRPRQMVPSDTVAFAW